MWVLAWCPSLFALDPLQSLNQLYHTAWGAKNGITGEVEALAQTTDGYLWVGTTDGLFRFDGLSFERYQPESGSLMGTYISALMAVPDGGLWIGYGSNGASFLRNGRVTNYSDEEGFPVSTVRGFARDGSGHIWAAAIGGLARLEGSRWTPGPGEHRSRYADWNYPGKTAWALLAGRAGTLWAATDGEIVFLRKGAKRFEDTGIRTGRVSGLTQSRDGTFLFYDYKLRRLRTFRDGEATQTEIMPPVATRVNVAMFDGHGSLWLGGDELYRVPVSDEPLSNRIKFTTERFSAAQGLSGRGVNALLEDREGNIWVGTDSGLDRFRVRNVTWFPLPGRDFTLVAGSHGDVWASSLRFPMIRVQDRKPAANGPTRVYTAYRDPDGSVWFGADNGLVHWQNGKVVKVPVPEQVLDLSHKATPPDPIIVSAITKDRSGNLWVAFGGSGEFRLTNGVWTFVPILPDHPDWSANYAFTDSVGRVWLCWFDRIAQYDHGKVLVFRSDKGLDIGPPNVVAEYRGRIWAGGQSGLAFFDGHRFHRVHVAGTTGFSSIFGIVGARDNGLWLATGTGIIHIPAREIEKVTANPEHRVEFETFDLLSDLPDRMQTNGSVTYASSAIQASDGRLWFATVHGAVRVDPAHIYRNPLPPPVSIRSIIADEKVYSPFSQPQLPALTKNIRIDYAALSLSIPERVRYRYKLEPLDSDWEEAGARREAFFTRLPPGQYSFRVIACNNDGVWNTVGATIAFSVAPAWFQTRWFLAICIAAALLVMYFLYQLRLKQLKRRFHLALEARVDERTRIARELHDTLLQSFHGLMLRLQVVDDLLPAGKAKEELERSLDRGDQAIGEGRKAVYALRFSSEDPADLAEDLRALGEELATQEAAFHLVVEGSPRKLHPVIRDELYRIVREALRNAFSHARAHHIEAEIAYAPRVFRLRIRDDGEGIPPPIIGKGRPGHFGMSGMRERAKNIGANLSIWSRAGAGTEIELNMPGSLAYQATPRRFRFGWLRNKRKET
ncbi:MAG TPA: two-component regulator propeller domain-containing protein [Bryobacteraceae bacterium]|nr:two-component regulator propeller domain-containing protein [Candidatus Acidoferrales bacterium]